MRPHSKVTTLSASFKTTSLLAVLGTLIANISFSNPGSSRWGFFAHQKINHLAVYTLPPELGVFFKYHIQYVEENAVNPDRRRYAIPEEAARHYIDIDIYGDSAIYKMPRYWNEAVEKYSEDTLQAYGIVPWHITTMKNFLTKAFREKDIDRILRYATDLGHYIGDANVPLHTTENYNGQLTNQYGIHGFWESRLPELFFEDYDFFVGKAEYIKNPQMEAWKAVTNAHLALDSVLRFEKQLNAQFAEDKKYTFEERGGSMTQTYSREYAAAFHQMLGAQVENRMRASIKMVGDFWFTCWVDAGQPDMYELVKIQLTEKQKKELDAELEAWKVRKVGTREHEGGKLP
jgi:hypothetical protein